MYHLVVSATTSPGRLGGAFAAWWDALNCPVFGAALLRPFAFHQGALA